MGCHCTITDMFSSPTHWQYLLANELVRFEQVGDIEISVQLCGQKLLYEIAKQHARWRVLLRSIGLAKLDIHQDR